MPHPHRTKAGRDQTYAIAHSAHCKLNMASSAPDRNLRFVLGHVFTLDRILLRVAEIEDMGETSGSMASAALANNEDDGSSNANDKEPEGQRGSLAGGSVSFQTDSPGALRRREKKPNRNQKMKIPPLSLPKPEAKQVSEFDMDDDDEDEGVDYISDDEENGRPATSDVDEDADDDGLGLTRFASASAAPPRMIPSGDGDSDPDEEEPTTPPSLPLDYDYQTLLDGEKNEELSDLYAQVNGCPCHKYHGELCKGMWEVKDPNVAGGGYPNKKIVVMQVEA